MSFQTTCIVFVPDEQQQTELVCWLGNINWLVGYTQIRGARMFFANAEIDECFWTELNERQLEVVRQNTYDCGENIEMFKALAAMNSDNDREQWFVADCIMKFDVLKGHVKTESGRRIIYPGEWFKVLVPHIGNVRAKWMSLYRPKFLSHKATKDEIIEHFNKQKQ